MSAQEVEPTEADFREPNNSGGTNPDLTNNK